MRVNGIEVVSELIDEISPENCTHVVQVLELSSTGYWVHSPGPVVQSPP